MEVTREFKMNLQSVEEKSLKGEAITLEEAEGLIELDGKGVDELFEISRGLKERIGKHLNFYFTGRHFPPISVTGNSCALKCKHCGRLLLNKLFWAKNNQEVIDLCKKFEEKGAVGCLLTGGCRPDGTVPIDEFTPAIKEVKEKTHLTLIAHTGLISPLTARELKKAGLDGVSLDVVGRPGTSEEVYGIRIEPEKYRESLIALEMAGFDVISPHVCVGLEYGRLGHELKALDIISSISPTTVEIIALMPLRGTPMRNIKPDPLDVAKVIAIAQLMFPTTPITLGCAHSKGKDRALIDELAIKAGVTSIALPTPRAEKIAKDYGYKINRQNTCCAVPYKEGL
jgi:hypothetical protein